MLLLAVAMGVPPPTGAQPAAPPATGSYDAAYGTPQFVELEEIVRGAGNYQKKAVRTKATVDLLAGGYYLLRGQGAIQVLGIPVPELAPDVRAFVGRELEVVGLVRPLPDRQATQNCPAPAPESKCDDPLLPPLPNAQGTLPRQSITFWRITDLTEARRVVSGPKDSLSLESLVFSRGRYDNQRVRIFGQFRGRNLYGDLPAKSERSPLDWVIKDGTAAIWVVGKEPKGSGFSLDVTLKSDTGRWVEVAGKPETVDGVTYLRAQAVHLAKPPTPPPE